MSELLLLDLDVAPVEIVEGVRLVIGDTVEGAPLPMFHSFDGKGWLDLVRSTGNEASECFQALPVRQTSKSF